MKPVGLCSFPPKGNQNGSMVMAWPWGLPDMPLLDTWEPFGHFGPSVLGQDMGEW